MSEQLTEIKEREIPTLQELVKDVGLYQDQDKLNFLLNQEPPKTWVKEHPYIRGHKYIPIDKIEYLMRKIFKEYRIEVLREGTSFNGVFVTIRLHYKNLTSNEWSFHDGIGAIHLQTKKGSSPANLNDINNGALSMAYPLAKTLAIKDAADMFGKLFGSDLNRRDTLPASMDKPMVKLTEEQSRIISAIKGSKTQDELDFIRSQKEAQTEEYLSLIKEKQKELNKTNSEETFKLDN